ncbi:MAG TPA: DUF3089 domain-containing protein [Acidimicrobiales bacterium]|nr:DUF3089 domain-containing protein [Acidimicrobiales bacterium]
MSHLPAHSIARRRRLPAGLAVAALALSLAACSSPDSTGTPTSGKPTTTTLSTAGTSVPPSPTRLTGSQPVWLCRPGLAGDPCTQSIDYTSVPARGASTVHDVTLAGDPKVDCFYVYPTVSGEKGANANLAIQPAETGTARDQASPFSADCNVWAPMYRQVTLQALNNAPELLKGTPIAFASLLSAWKDYLANDNKGRPFVLIGHSQGAAMIIRLIETQIDDNATLRKRLVSAIILGGNVAVPTGKTVGGSFKHVPACTSLAETGCVVAYSSFLQPPPPDSLFGRPGKGVSFLSGQSRSAGLQVLCVNPANPGGSASLAPLFPTASTTATGHWATYPGLYSASCVSSGGATWLQVDVHQSPGDSRPVVTQSLGPAWGLHLWDPNMTMLDLVALVHDEIAHLP